MKIDFSSLPKNPGCYLYKDENGKIIYIGKAKNLKKRVSSYFTKKDLDEKTKTMLSNAFSIDFIITKSELEALLLENNLIKKHSPKYNILLKDSKSYAYLELTKENFPKLILSREKSDKKELFGPFTSSIARKEVLTLTNKIFKLRTCKKIPKRTCLRYSLGICSAPCINKISKEEYQNTIELAKYFLKGKNNELIKILEEKMKEKSKLKEFEEAIKYKNQISALKFLEEKQNAQRNKNYDENIFYYKIEDEKIYIIMFKISKGILEEKKEFSFDNSENSFEEFLTRYYSENEIPKEIILNENLTPLLKKFLSLKKGSSVKINIPIKGEKKELLDLAKENLESTFFQGINKVKQLKKEIKLDFLPSRIECFDISHISGSNTVASMVYFKNGVPDKKSYRKFKISFEGNDDFASMHEVVKRRYSRLIKEKSSLPDLILIDGGKGQLHYAKKALEELNLRIPIISLAKEFEEIYFADSDLPKQLGEKSKARLFLQEIRDEAHRFAISYNRILRRNNLLKKNGK